MPYPSLVFAPRPSARVSLIRLYISPAHQVSTERDAVKKSKVAPGPQEDGVGFALVYLTSGSL
jgi:hypothetical protein